MKRLLLFQLCLTCVLALSAQDAPKRVLFIGNSYTEVNNLPQLVQRVAESVGDVVEYQSNTPGGCTFSQHCNNGSMELIRQGGWDVVVLQEQSQLPSFPQSQVEADVFPYAQQLVSAVYASNPEGEAMFYMTWGRKEGDAPNAAYFPVLGTYEGMDSMLYERYMYMARTYDASVCPVGRVWRYLRANNPEIELYQLDNSHPSQAGSYAAACAFYTMIFHKSPLRIAFDSDLETSVALGFGFRCGFLGLLHLEIIQERLEREYNLDLVTTAPSVIYKIHKTNGEVIDLTNPTNLPDPSEIEYMEEPIVDAEIMVTTEFIGPIMDLCQERRGQYIEMEYMEETRALLKYKLPLNEIIYDFFDALKSRSRGYASLDYELAGYQRSELVKLDILVNKEEVDALSFIVHADTAYERGRKMCEKLKEEIPRQLFEIPIQAAIGSKIIARETVKALRKDVLAKCYGGDITRKKKLLEKQKEGKKRMRQVGNVEIPQKAFMSVLKLDEN